MKRLILWLASLVAHWRPRRTGETSGGQNDHSNADLTDDERAALAQQTLAEFRADVRARLVAEIPFTVDEWVALGDDDVGMALKTIYTEEVDRWRNQRLALLGRFVVDAFSTQSLGMGALWDELPEEQQDRLTLQRMEMLRKCTPPETVDFDDLNAGENAPPPADELDTVVMEPIE